MLKRRGWGTFEVNIIVKFLPGLQAVCELTHNLSFDGPHASGTIYALTLPSLAVVQGGGDHGSTSKLRAEPVGHCKPDREGWVMSRV